MNDLLLTNARIWTSVERLPWASTALVRDGRFAFVGDAASVNASASAETFDAGGRLVVPGLVDGHVHLLQTGLAMTSVDLKGVDSVAEAVRRVAERVASTSQGGWISGAGWDQNLWPGAAFPTRHDLDAVAPDHPVVLIHTSAHCVWVNSAALREAGITATTADPEGGRIDRDADGEPTGILRDNASVLVYSAMPSPTRDERVNVLRTAIAQAQSLGLTGVHAMDMSRGELNALRSLHESGVLTMRVHAYLSQALLEYWIGNEERTGNGDDVLRIGGVKFFADGALGSLTAWMLQPYEDTSDVGLPLQPVHELEERVRLSLKNGLAPAIHAIGDRANKEVLDLIERVQSISPRLPRRIEHAQLLEPADSMRFAELGVIASMQPVHATQDYAKVDREWGERGSNAYLFETLRWTGATLAFGSDSPVETIDPIAGIHAAVTRQTAAGMPEGGWYPDERVTLETALTAYTSGCAAAAGDHDRVGKIAQGYLGDFVMLSQNLFDLEDSMAILDAKVEATVVGGEVVYRR